MILIVCGLCRSFLYNKLDEMYLTQPAAAACDSNNRHQSSHWRHLKGFMWTLEQIFPCSSACGSLFFFDKSKFKSITIKLQSLCQFCSHTYTFYLISNSLHLLLSLTGPNRGSLNRRSVLMKQQTNIEASNIFIITIAHSSKTKFWAKKEKLDYQTIELISIESIY